jgi:hypothetical protein
VDYKEEQFEGLISSARSDAEKEELSKIILELDAELFNKVTEMSISELEEFIEESTTKNSIKPYIKSHILDKRKTLGIALVALAVKTGLFIDDIEKGIDSLSSLVDKLRKASSAQGIDIQSNDLIKIFSAYIANDQKTLENYAKNTRLSRPPLATINGSPNTQILKTIPSYDEYNKLGDTEKGIYFEHFKHLYGGFKNDTYELFLEKLKEEAYSKSQFLSDEINKIKTSIPVSSERNQFTIDKSANKSNVQFIADFLLWGNAYPGTRDPRGFGIAKDSDEIGNMNNLERKLKSAYGNDAKALINSSDYKKMSIEQKYYALAQFLQSKKSSLSKVNKKSFSSQFSPQNPVVATQAEVVELKEDLKSERLPGLQKELEDVNSLIDSVVEQQSKKLMTVKEVLELIYEFVKDSDEELASEIEAALKSGDSRRQRNIIRKNILGVESAGDQSWASLFESDKDKNPKRLETIGDFIKDKVGFGKGITIDEAFNMTVSKGYDIAYGALMAHYDREIEATERRNQRLLELEQQKQESMLSNENMSASEREVIQKKFAERQRKMQEALDKKVAEQRKKQALAELSINYAKGMAEVFIREVSSKGGLGLLSSAALMGLMTTLYLVQRNAIDKQKFAGGGYTGSGYGQADSTGQRPVGIVHEKELVIDRNTLAKNFDPLMSMYANMRRGASFEEFALAYMSGKAKSGFVGGVKSGLYASGGYTGNSTDNVIVNVEMGSIRVLDDVDLAIMVERGGKRRRFING